MRERGFGVSVWREGAREERDGLLKTWKNKIEDQIRGREEERERERERERSVTERDNLLAREKERNSKL